MDNLAIALVTCDKYEFIWKDWHKAFKSHWSLDLPMYFCGEELKCPFKNFKQIDHEAVEADQWTAKLRAQIEQIPEENIFLLMDDLLFLKNISEEFQDLYDIYKELNADALRIMMRASAARTDNTTHKVMGSFVKQLKQSSAYLISYSPNIYKKKFLLECLQWDESPWDSEIFGSGRIRSLNRNIYMHTIDGWCENTVVKGEKI